MPLKRIPSSTPISNQPLPRKNRVASDDETVKNTYGIFQWGKYLLPVSPFLFLMLINLFEQDAEAENEEIDERATVKYVFFHFH